MSIHIPHHELSPEALRGVIESFVLREGTDYGECEYSLDDKVADVREQLDRGEARIEFDPDTQSLNIVVTQVLKEHCRSAASSVSSPLDSNITLTVEGSARTSDP